MAYHKPFTPQQRREAVMACQSYRRHLSVLRRSYPPANDEQRELLAGYAEAIKEMTAELGKPDRTVAIGALNQSDAWARWRAMEYWRVRNSEQ